MVFCRLSTRIRSEPQLGFGNCGNADLANTVAADMTADALKLLANQKNADVRIEEEFHSVRSRSWISGCSRSRMKSGENSSHASKRTSHV